MPRNPKRPSARRKFLKRPARRIFRRPAKKQSQLAGKFRPRFSGLNSSPADGGIQRNRHPARGYLCLNWQRLAPGFFSVWLARSTAMHYSIRDLLWLTLLVAIAMGWWMDHRRYLQSVPTIVTAGGVFNRY